MGIISSILLACCVWFFPVSLDYLASASWPSKQCQACVPSHGIGLKLDQSEVGHFYKFCTTITPAHLAFRIDCKSKVLWVDNPIPLLGTFSGYKSWPVAAPYPPLLEVFSRFTLLDSREFLLHQVSISPHKALSPISVITTLSFHCSYPYLPLVHPQNVSSSPSQGDPYIPTLSLPW